jgi:hypothetical protein
MQNTGNPLTTTGSLRLRKTHDLIFQAPSLNGTRFPCFVEIWEVPEVAPLVYVRQAQDVLESITNVAEELATEIAHHLLGGIRSLLYIEHHPHRGLLQSVHFDTTKDGQFFENPRWSPASTHVLHALTGQTFA